MFCKVFMPERFRYLPGLEIHWPNRCCQNQVLKVVEVGRHHFTCLSRLYSTKCFHEAPVVTFGISVVFCEGQALSLLTYRTNPCFLDGGGGFSHVFIT